MRSSSRLFPRPQRAIRRLSAASESAASTTATESLPLQAPPRRWIDYVVLPSVVCAVVGVSAWQYHVAQDVRNRDEMEHMRQFALNNARIKHNELKARLEQTEREGKVSPKEEQRENAEKKRVRQELERVSQELERHQQAAEAAAAEQATASDELIRISQAVKKEQQRRNEFRDMMTQENKRVTQELERQREENKRTAMAAKAMEEESARAVSEVARVNAETFRIQNELARQNNELLRIKVGVKHSSEEMKKVTRDIEKMKVENTAQKDESLHAQQLLLKKLDEEIGELERARPVSTLPTGWWKYVRSGIGH